MSIFEDLIEELKEENLIEETVIEFHRDHPSGQPNAQHSGNYQTMSAPVVPAANAIAPDRAEVPPAPTEWKDTKKNATTQKPKIIVSEREYFRKRAMDEVNGLQMVELVLSGVEREQMKLLAKTYDDLPVKLALHDFLQVTHETSSTEHAQSEFRLMQETENWCSALAHRDKHIPVAHLRRHCETTRPPLSSQALIALARFYRNSPFSEPVRSKFELVVTRLFSREDETEERALLLSREEIVQQLKELYADWSSIQLYSSDEEDSEILIAVLKFEDFVEEALNTENFEQLIATDFFNRLRSFKQNCNENFFAPRVTVAAVEANVKIGNRYLELLKKEQEKFNAATLEEKYGFLHDQAISDATGKTFELAELLNERSGNGKKEAAEIVEVTVKEQEAAKIPKVEKAPRSKFFAVNKWLLSFTILTIAGCFGLYGWAEYQTQEIKLSPSIKKVNLEGSEFKDFVQTARIDNDTFYGVTTGVWESISREKKEEILKKLLSVGAEKNYKKVHLVNPGGRTVGFSSADKTEIYNH
ncbi:MAG TPA: hypothetical protein VIL74_06215 [Pyrinomonadaceae bacterium]|jgi:hypothetical protein